MARGYSATLEVKCWKEHTCCYCGTAYRYLLRKKKTAGGTSQQSAVTAATGACFWLVFLLVGASLVLMPGSEFARFMGRWPSNPHTHPIVVGPGDTFWAPIELDGPDPIKSLRGYWAATGTGKIVNGLQINL